MLCPRLAARTRSGFSSFNLAKFRSASQFQILSDANRRFISSSVRWFDSGYNAQTIGRVRILQAAKMKRVYSLIALNMTGHSNVSHPFPIDHPATENPLPFALILVIGI